MGFPCAPGTLWRGRKAGCTSIGRPVTRHQTSLIFLRRSSTIRMQSSRLVATDNMVRGLFACMLRQRLTGHILHPDKIEEHVVELAQARRVNDHEIFVALPRRNGKRNTALDVDSILEKNTSDD